MNIRTSLAALAATFLVALGGCQMASTVGDTESTPGPKGGVAFRLSSQNVHTLQSQSLHLQYKVSGVGMDTLAGSVQIDTAPIFINEVPVGLRFIELTAVDRFGVETWYGRDSLLVSADQYAFAHIVLHRLAASPKGTIVLDVSLDSMEIGIDSIRPPLDTVWTTRTYYSFYPQSYTSCSAPTWAGSGDSLQIYCTRSIGLPIASDTTWADTTVHYPVADTARWCRLIDTTEISGGGAHASFHCLRLHYQPYSGPVDTIWRDTASYSPADTLVRCHSPSLTTVLCYRPNPDSSRTQPSYRRETL